MCTPGRSRTRTVDSVAPGLSFRSVVAVSLVVLLLIVGAGLAAAGEKMTRVAVFPVGNLSGGSVPADEVRQFLINRLASGGIGVLGSDALEAFITRHRVRYTAGIDAATAASLKQETGVDGVVIASIDLSANTVPPKVALTVRLVSLEAAPAVVWADDAALAGDEAPGLFGLGLVNDYKALLTRALDRLGGSLLAYLKSGEDSASLKRASKFGPKVAYRSLTIQPGRPYSVAVVPFFNLSERRDAGEILALLFMRHLSSFKEFRVVEAGVTRGQLLDARVIMDSGLSIADAETVAGLIDADFVLAGRVIRYQDYDGPADGTRAEFSVVLIEKKSRRVVWSSSSYNAGSDGVRFFGRGASRTAHGMATQMVRLATEMIAGRAR
jgi:TolB-like protein